MPKVNNVLVSYCGVLCYYCPAYRRGLCEGCDVHADVCEFAKCARRRDLTCCLQCDEFPCRTHEEGFEWSTEEFGLLNWRIYSDVFIEVLRRMRERSGSG